MYRAQTIVDLLGKLRKGKLSEDESSLLEKWCEEHPRNAELYQEIADDRFLESLVLKQLLEVDTEGIYFRDLSFQEALALAARQKKLIFIDAYTVWCGPCKMMNQQVFNRKDVGDFMNLNFINLKIDMEKGEGLELVKMFQICAFPTFLLVNASGEVVHRLVGFQEAMPFMRSLRKGMNEEMSLSHLQKQYQAGDRSVALMKNYVQALAESSDKRQINQVLSAYFSDLTETERFSPEHSFVFEYAPSISEERFAYFLQHADEFLEKLGKSRFEAIVDQVCVPLLMSYQAQWKSTDLLKKEFGALSGLSLSEASESGAIMGLIEKAFQQNIDAVMSYLDANIHRFSDKNQLFAMYQLLSIPMKGTDEQRVT